MFMSSLKDNLLLTKEEIQMHCSADEFQPQETLTTMSNIWKVQIKNHSIEEMLQDL